MQAPCGLWDTPRLRRLGRGAALRTGSPSPMSLARSGLPDGSNDRSSEPPATYKHARRLMERILAQPQSLSSPSCLSPRFSLTECPKHNLPLIDILPSTQSAANQQNRRYKRLFISSNYNLFVALLSRSWGSLALGVRPNSCTFPRLYSGSPRQTISRRLSYCGRTRDLTRTHPSEHCCGRSLQGRTI